MLRVVAAQLLPGDAAFAADLLEGLTTVPRFGMTVMFIAGKDKQSEGTSRPRSSCIFLISVVSLNCLSCLVVFLTWGSGFDGSQGVSFGPVRLMR
jgi:hypothetical protein